MDGVININKPLGITSHDVVYRLRKILSMKKIGHTGTLDPDATGVLPMCIGRGTKISEFLMADEKQYIAEITFGIVTDTQDISGEVLSRADVNFTREEFETVIGEFIGEIRQIPPMYSAIKIDGKKLYELAREGKVVEREARTITVSGIEILDFCGDKARLKVDCSKGTYIRTLCHDIGQKLGCGACMSALTRTRSGSFFIENSFTLQEVEEKVASGDFGFMISIEEVFSDYEKIILAENNAKKIRNGIKTSTTLPDGVYCRIYDEKKNFLCIAMSENGYFSILKTFFGEGQV